MSYIKKILKKIAPTIVIEWLKKARLSASLVFLPLINKNKIFANFYYIFVQKFSGEQLAVIRGRRAYYQSLENIGSSCALLRRNTHRLEKGLIMRPRRSVFAEDYIQETVECYNEVVRIPLFDENEKKWAGDVLEQYFTLVRKTKITDEARKVYVLAREHYETATTELNKKSKGRLAYIPYIHTDLPSSSIKFDQLKVLFHKRRSVRWYKDQNVPFNVVQQAVNVASLAPSACNRQPYTFHFCNNKSKAVSIAKCAGGTSGFAENLPAIIVVVGDLSVYPLEEDRHLIYIDGSLATMQLMLALETLGLSTCSINWQDSEENENKIREIVELKDYERIVMLLSVGYADPQGGIPYSQKKNDEFILNDISKA